jgi:hypothetical protein
VNSGRAPVNAGRAPDDAGRASEDDDGATVDPGRAPAKHGSSQKTICYDCTCLYLNPSHFPSIQSCIRIFQKIIMNYYSGTIDITLNKNNVSM